MRSTFHTVLIWLMLLAVPVQGFAAASMALCEPIGAAVGTVQTHHHDHAQMAAHGDHAHHQQHQQPTSDDHAAGKCGSCGVCCLGMTMTPSAELVLPSLRFDSERIVALDAFPSSTVPDYPDRPPQASIV